MKRVVTSRCALLMSAAALVVIAACSDSGSTQPNLPGPNATTTNGPRGSGDTATKGGPRDTSGSRTPAPTPVSKYTLTVHVGTPQPSATDTLSNTPLPGATVSVIQQTYTYTPGNGADTVHITSTVIASGSSDASGNVSFSDLKGTASYLIRAEPPKGSTLGPATTYVNQAFFDTVKLTMILHGL